MALFTGLNPSYNQTDVPRTTTLNATILADGYNGAQINTLNATINGASVISNGSFVDGYNGQILSGSGKHVITVYPKKPYLSAAAKIDISWNVLDDYGSLDAYNYSFFTAGYGATVATVPTIDAYVTQRACDISKPFFPPTDLGLVAARDAGVGTEVDLEWKQAYPYHENNIVFYNLYFSTKRIFVFDEAPKFLISGSSATVGGLPPGDTHFFGLRVGEFNPADITTTGMKKAGPNMFYYPSSSASSNIGTADTIIPVSSISGFPARGIIHIGSELIKYTSLQPIPPAFVSSLVNRGYAGTQAETHEAGDEIKLYHGKQDANTAIVQVAPTFFKPNDALTWVKTDGYGPDGYRDGYDGYDAYYNNLPGANQFFDGYDGYFRFRQEPFDSITTDGTNNDNSGTFDAFDFCGTWRVRPPELFMQGQCDKSYWGGVQKNADGYRVKVPDVRVHMLQREELLLESTGEPFVLLRRMWTGIRCACMMNRREHSDARCPICYSTGFTQGYLQFFNPRRADCRILVRVDPADDDLQIVDRGGLEPMLEATSWTMPFPAIKDRDFLVRFNPDGTEEFRYEVLSVNRVRAFFTQTGAQKMRIKRIPKTDIIYQFPVVRDCGPIPATLSTGTSSAPGMKAHSHQFILPEGVNPNTAKFATLASEGHNHVIFNGVVQSILGHTHTLP